MHRFFESKLAFGAVLSLFAVTFAWNVSQGIAAAVPGHMLVAPENTDLAHGPSIPPDPWEGTGNVRVG